ncbi:ABC-type multidrug transport system, ATPase component [Paenibacillus algorifonticola]|uniref:ABC-type multidrug transport system, ATPase component n=1 Tax=Paenibacillus algorifonticola TaxID=684063 RepID=A0A1I2A886_9BACL|nr:ABC transporter ATP-binding protein [Paenibacillus algorifonticola]SFE40171.1 ABC-type multidrug transport system, ATPase component [Paenibacillus algorifonticola]
MLTVQQVSKRFGSFSALEDINLEFTNGVYGLLAPNGAGKTTLIKMLVTLLFPSEGEILYNGENIIKADERYREQLGYLPQQFGYYKHYSPHKYLLYIAALKGMRAADAKPRIAELLKLVALEDVMDKKMRKFSGGMIQRVGIAQAMLNDPRILILDEPTAGLDPKERVRFRNMLAQLARNRIVILSTHIVSDVESIADEIIMIKDKRVLHKSPIQGICSQLEGMVFETTIDYEAADEFRGKYLSISERQEQGRLKFRFIGSGEPQPNWIPTSPNLEDVFIYIYQDEAKADETA